MECLLGLATKNFAMIAADTANVHSILLMKSDENKLHKMSDKVVMGVVGNAGDTTQFAEYIAKNIHLYKMRNGYHLSPYAAAHYTRFNLADYLRSQTPYMVNLLIAGYDDDKGGELYFMDYLASCIKVPFGSHGYGGILARSIMDRYYRSDMDVKEAYNLMVQCVTEIHKRLILNLPQFNIQLIDKDGIHQLRPIKIEGIKPLDEKESLVLSEREAIVY